MDAQEEKQVVTFRELAFGQRSTTAEEGNNADVNKGLEDLKMESSASTGTDGAVVTVAPSRVRGGGGQANEGEPGKKGGPCLHLSSPPAAARNHSQQQGSEELDGKAKQKLKMIFREAAAASAGHWPHAAPPPPPAANSDSGPAAMETDCCEEEDAKLGLVAAAAAGRGVDMETTKVEEAEEAYQLGNKEVPRCDSGNLDSSPDYGRREASQGNSRHICKHCAKEFSSGRALGGHMRAHGSLMVEEGLADGVMETPQQQQQLNGSSMMVHHHAPQFFTNADGASDPVLSMTVKQEGGSAAAYSKRSRSNGKGIEGRRSPGGRRSKHSGSKHPQQHREQVTPKNSAGEETDDIKQEPEQDEQNAAEPEPSISSDDGDNIEGATTEDGVTDGGPGSNVCNVCSEEFDTSKQLNAHKMTTHSLYGLRRNPKRSRRFMDRDYTNTQEPAPESSAQQGKKTSSSSALVVTTPEEKVEEEIADIPTCTECKKQFQSWKALFGHMRCHPERNYRGIRPPPGGDSRAAASSKDKRLLLQQQRTSSAERQQQLTGSRRKDVPPPIAPVSQESGSESEAEGRVGVEPAADDHHGKPAASDNESDNESIEGAYLHSKEERQPASSFMWSKRSRSKRPRHIVRSLHSVTKTAAVPVVTPPDNDEMEHETAMGLMMLARKESGKEFNWLGAGGRSSSCEIVRPSGLENALSDTERDDLDEQLDDENASDYEDKEYGQDHLRHHNSKGKAKLEAMDNVSLCEENEEGGDDCEAGEQEAGGAKPKYMCNTCKRVFKSHQALGGHRASHKKVKGCFARTNASDGQENPDEDMISEEFRSDEQLPPDLQDQSQSEGNEKERQFSAFSKEDSGEILNVSARNKSKGHVCTICGRVFNSGQALGGHKRCHYNTKEATSSEATSSTNNTTKLPTAAAAAVAGQRQGSGGTPRKAYKEELLHRGASRSRLDETVHMPEKSVSDEFSQPAAPVRQVKEKFLDLNLPAPVNDDEMEVEVYHRPQPNLMCPAPAALPPKKVELKGAADFPATIGTAKSSNFDADRESGKPKDGGYFPLYPSSYPSLEEENNQDLDGGQDTGFRGDEVDFSLRYVQCNICDSRFSAVEALSKHRKTHTSMTSAVSGLTSISS